MVGAGWMDVTRRCSCGPETVVLYEREGQEMVVAAGEKALRFLLLTGKPLGEPVAWYGPIVMNTQAELRQAMRELQLGTFIREPSA